MTSTDNRSAEADAPAKDSTVASEVVLEQWTLDMFDTIAQDEGFVDYTVTHSSGSNLGDGFMGIMRRVLIRGIRNGVEATKSVMLKMPPTNKMRQKQFHTDVLFERESFMYRTVLPLFVQFQKSHGFTEESGNGFFSFPKHYAIVCDAELDRYAIVLEDLKEKRYSMFDKFDVIDSHHVRLIMTELARFHAVSFALKDQRPEAFEPLYGLTDVFVEQMLKKNLEMMTGFMDMSLTKIMEFMGDDDIVLKEKIDRLRKNLVVEFEDCVELRPERRASSVVNHGDCWNNNMMYQYLEGNTTPQKICLIDFQIARFSSPVIDIVYFLFTSTTKEVRDEHLAEYLDVYHKELSRTIRLLGSDPERLFSRAEFDRHLKRYGKYGCLIAPMLLQVITAPADELPDMDQLAEESQANGNIAPEMLLKGKAEQAYNKRVCDVFRDADALGYLHV